MLMITKLTDNELIETYHKAVYIELEQAFISLLKDEIDRRGCKIDETSISVSKELSQR
jgi:hypothetical protein